MPIIGPYGSGKSVLLRQLLINPWRLLFLGVPIAGTGRPALAEPPAEVQRTLMERWQAGGGMPFLGAYTDVLVDRDANDIVAEFMRDRIRETVADPAVAELLLPHTYPVGELGRARATTTSRCSTGPT